MCRAPPCETAMAGLGFRAQGCSGFREAQENSALVSGTPTSSFGCRGTESTGESGIVA